MNPNYILFFDEINKDSLALVGGKGANLGEMTQAGFPVPGGFCVTTAAYHEFLMASNLSEFITATLATANLENVSQVGAKLRAKLQQAAMPDSVAREIVQAWKKTGDGAAYAVRSSATAEDLAFASFAGQQDTYLNISGEQGVLDAVRNCWASLFTDRAILYRAQNKIDHQRVSMSVAIQKMILPDVSGILFTADPVSGNRKIISIDASYGLGEALVSGLVSPDLYKVCKKGMSIEGKTIAEKKLAILPVKGGGTKKVAITGEKSTSQVLSDDQIKRLAEIGMAIEKHYGCPQDIEWCKEGDTLYVVQSRAITSLFPLPEPRPQDDGLHVYFSIGHFQNMTEPISRLGLDVIRMMVRVDGNNRDEQGSRVFTSAAGRLYIDISRGLKFRKGRQLLASVLSNVDVLSANAITELAQRPGFEAQIHQVRDGILGFVLFLLPVVFKALGNLWFKNPAGTVARVNALVEAYEKDWRARMVQGKRGVERLDAIYECANFLPVFVPSFMPLVAPGVISFRILSGLEQKWLGTDELVNALAQGLEGNITTEAGLWLGDLADKVRKSPALLAEFENSDYATLVERVNRLDGYAEFKRDFRAFLDKHGTRAVGEIDVARQRWSENPALLVYSLMAMVRTAQDGAHRREYLKTAEKAKIAADELVQRVAARRGKLPARLVARLVKVLCEMYPIREHHKFLFVKLLFIIKQALLEEAADLVQKGHLANVQDIFCVGLGELYRAIQTDESLIPLVEQRQADYAHFAKLSPPRILTSEGEAIQGSYNRDDLPAGALPGVAASAGVVEGIARVITDPAKESINKGEILVAPFTDPGWTPLFINAAGLVLEIGGLLTHGTVVAREYGIPAVVGVTDATKNIKAGQRIRVDGNSGFVIVIEE